MTSSKTFALEVMCGLLSPEILGDGSEVVKYCVVELVTQIPYKLPVCMIVWLCVCVRPHVCVGIGQKDTD